MSFPKNKNKRFSKDFGKICNKIRVPYVSEHHQPALETILVFILFFFSFCVVMCWQNKTNTSNLCCWRCCLRLICCFFLSLCISLSITLETTTPSRLLFICNKQTIKKTNKQNPTLCLISHPARRPVTTLYPMCATRLLSRRSVLDDPFLFRTTNHHHSNFNYCY